MVKKPVIVISGQPGCGSTRTGKLLSDKLRLEFFSVGTYYKKLAEEKTKTKVEWKSPTIVSTDYLSTKEGSGKKLHNDIDAMQIEKAEKGNIIIESKLGIHMLPKADFKVWLKASKEVRAKRCAERDGIGIDVAKKEIERKDSTERSKFKDIYGFDSFSLEKQADLVIDTSDKTLEEVVKIIISSLKKKLI